MPRSSAARAASVVPPAASQYASTISRVSGSSDIAVRADGRTCSRSTR
jgi:hypothetical protein